MHPFFVTALLSLVNTCFGQIGVSCFNKIERQRFMSKISDRLVSTQNYIVQKGELRFTDIKECEEMVTCSFQNGNSPYGYIKLPLNPYEDDHKEPERDNVTSWRFSDQEAVIILFCTPPPSAYFGLTPYVMEKWLEKIERWLPLFGSLGDTTNDHNFKYFDNLRDVTANKYYSNAFVTLSGNRNVYLDVNQALNDVYGIDPEFINNQINLPFGDASLNLSYGLNKYNDLYNLFFRQALSDSQEEWDEYVNEKPFEVLRITRNINSQVELDLYAEPVLKPRKLDYDEKFLIPSLRALSQIVREKFSDYNLERSFFSFGPLQFVGADWGGECYKKNLLCFGDNRDSQYVATVPPFFWRSNNTMAIYVGVNHNATKMATYSNIVIYDFLKQVGVSSISNRDYAGSADEYLRGTEHEENSKFLYVVKFKRECQGERFCVSVEQDNFPHIKDGRLSLFMTRAYVSPNGVGPDLDDLVLPIALWGTRE